MKRKFIKVGERFFVADEGFVMLYRWTSECGAEIIPSKDYTPKENIQAEQLKRDKP